MASLYYQKLSPYYWINYYDIFEPDPAKRRKRFCTKIPFTQADLKKIKEAEELRAKGVKAKINLLGNPVVNRKIREFEEGLVDLKINKATDVTLKKRFYLSDGFEKYKEFSSVPGSKNELKEKTLGTYKQAVDHFISAAGDKYIHQYNVEDYNKLLRFFADKGSRPNTISIYTRPLKKLWTYFINQGWIAQNIIEATEGEETDPDPIPLDDLFKILQFLKTNNKDYPHQFQIVYFMLLTGCRPSSAIVQLKKDIDLKEKFITIRNVKTGHRKKKPFYQFPLYPELLDLVKDILKDSPKKEERLFHMYSVVEKNYTWPLSFWDRAIAALLKETDDKGKTKEPEIQRSYSLKQIRSTLASFLINAIRMDIFTVQKLLDHANIKVTEKHYVRFKLNNARKLLSGISYDKFKMEE